MTDKLKAMNQNTAADQPISGLSEPVHDAQRVFRSVLDAMSQPGKIVALDQLNPAPAPLNKVTAAICLSLVDHETPIWSDSAIATSGQAMSHLQFHCNCPMTANPMDARTALISDGSTLTTLTQFCVGTDERPDLSSTVIIQVDGLSPDKDIQLTGPGIKSKRNLSVAGINEGFWLAVQANAELFPRGVDLILTTESEMVCLPRTTQVEI